MSTVDKGEDEHKGAERSPAASELSRLSSAMASGEGGAGDIGTELTLGASLDYLHLARLAGLDFILPEGVPIEMSSRFNATPLPFSPPWCEGLSNYRGELIPVYDLGLFLSRERTEAPESGESGLPTRLSRGARQGYFLIVGEEGRRAALDAESVATLVVPDRQALESVERPPDLLTELEVVSGWLSHDGHVFRELDIYSLLHTLSGNEATEPD